MVGGWEFLDPDLHRQGTGQAGAYGPPAGRLGSAGPAVPLLGVRLRGGLRRGEMEPRRRSLGDQAHGRPARGSDRLGHAYRLAGAARPGALGRDRPRPRPCECSRGTNLRNGSRSPAAAGPLRWAAGVFPHTQRDEEPPMIRKSSLVALVAFLAVL